MRKLRCGNSDNAQVGNWKSDGERGEVEKRGKRGIAILRYLPFRRVSVGESAFINAVTTPRKHLIAGGWVLHASKGRGVAVIVYP